MPGQSQGRGYASTESSVPALNVHSSLLTCTNTARGGAAAVQGSPLAPGSWTPPIFDQCPLCGKVPVEPVRVDGQLACWACTSACTICGSACVPGEDACSECVRHLGLQRAVVPV